MAITYDQAAHLLRRAGFGGDPDEITKLAKRDREKAVDSLLNYDRIDNQEMEERLQKSFNPKKFTPQDDLQLWWIVRMILTARPFEEKMTLFWHNHFATALGKVDYPLMYVQNQMLRSFALDRFDTLLLNVARDPAMLVWLDGVTNVLGSPNENFARELQELFTMGITDVITGQPNYSERDVKEIARAFTGWKFKQKDNKPYKPTFFIQSDEHDNTVKEIYGQAVNFSGEDVIEIVCARRSTARFLVKKLFEFFVYPLTNSAQDVATIEKFSDVYANNNHSIKSLMRAIFISDEFFGDRARFALVKSPAELIVGAIRMLEADYNPGKLIDGDFELYNQFRRMGFDLLNLQVGGFDTHSTQINPTNKFAGQHANLLQDFSDGIKAFYDDMAEHDLADKVVIMQWSEFGRRPEENASFGTDHGTASSLFVMGGGVHGGIYGRQPSLDVTKLDDAENMVFNVDFRSAYATILDRWLGSDSKAVLGDQFEDLGFLG